MLLGLFCVALAVAIVWPASAPGRVITGLMVRVHAWIARRVSFGQVAALVLLTLVIFGVVEIIGHEAWPMIATAAPEMLAWFVTFDIATYLDVMALAWALATIVRIRSVLAILRVTFRKPQLWALRVAVRVRRSVRRRSRGARKPRPTGTDAKHGPAWWPGYADPALAGV